MRRNGNLINPTTAFDGLVSAVCFYAVTQHFPKSSYCFVCVSIDMVQVPLFMYEFNIKRSCCSFIRRFCFPTDFHFTLYQWSTGKIRRQILIFFVVCACFWLLFVVYSIPGYLSLITIIGKHWMSQNAGKKNQIIIINDRKKCAVRNQRQSEQTNDSKSFGYRGRFYWFCMCVHSKIEHLHVKIYRLGFHVNVFPAQWTWKKNSYGKFHQSW